MLYKIPESYWVKWFFTSINKRTNTVFFCFWCMFVFIKFFYPTCTLFCFLKICALKYNLWGVADENQFEDPVQVSKEIDRSLFMAKCFRESGYPKVPDPDYFNREVRLDAYIDDDWELREDDPLVQTWQACEDKLPEELKDEEWDA